MIDNLTGLAISSKTTAIFGLSHQGKTYLMEEMIAKLLTDDFTRNMRQLAEKGDRLIYIAYITDDHNAGLDGFKMSYVRLLNHIARNIDDTDVVELVGLVEAEREAAQGSDNKEHFLSRELLDRIHETIANLCLKSGYLLDVIPKPVILESSPQGSELTIESIDAYFKEYKAFFKHDHHINMYPSFVFVDGLDDVNAGMATMLKNIEKVETMEKLFPKMENLIITSTSDSRGKEIVKVSKEEGPLAIADALSVEPYMINRAEGFEDAFVVHTGVVNGVNKIAVSSIHTSSPMEKIHFEEDIQF